MEGVIQFKGSEDQKLKAVKELKAQAESEFEHTGVQGRYLEKRDFLWSCMAVCFLLECILEACS